MRKLSDILYRLGMGEEAYNSLGQYTVSIVGAGNLGSLIALNLAINGVKRIKIVDPDFITYHETATSPIYDYSYIYLAKVEALKTLLSRRFPDIDVVVYPMGLTPFNIERVLKGSDVVIDATDNMATKYLVNRFMLRNHILAIHTYIDEGSGYIHITDRSRCMECIYDIEESLDLIFDSRGSSTLYMMTSSLVGEYILKYLGGDVELNMESLRISRGSIEKIDSSSRCNLHYSEDTELGYEIKDFDYQHLYLDGTFVYTSNEKIRLDLEPLSREIAKKYILVKRGAMGVLFEYLDNINVGVTYPGTIVVMGVDNPMDGYNIASKLVDEVLYKYVID